MKKNNLQNKLFESGLIEKGDSAKIEDFKRRHKKDYLKKYSKQYNAELHNKIVPFTKDEIQFLNQQAEKYNYKHLTPFLKDIIFAFFNDIIITPEKEHYNEIAKDVRSMKNDVLQSVKYIHLNESVTMNDIQQLIVKIDHLEISIERKLSATIPLKKWIQNQVQKDTCFISKLLKTISELID